VYKITLWTGDNEKVMFDYNPAKSTEQISFKRDYKMIAQAVGGAIVVLIASAMVIIIASLYQ
jgi:hypothetical protein